MASAHEQRTYHNTAILLPSGQVLVGGHAPIAALDTFNSTIPGGFSNNFRDPTFEIYNPPYMSWGPQPKISSVSSNFDRGASVTVATPQAPADRLGDAGAKHRPDPPGRRRSACGGASDHLTIENGSLQVSVPSASAVLPPGRTCCSSTSGPPTACSRARPGN